MFETTIQSVCELPSVTAVFLKQFSEERVFAFYGKMGAGKTTFIKALCQSMGTADTVTSPTFALVNEYGTKERGQIYHFDFYRIRNAEEALDIGLDEYLYSGNYCFIEWPEQVESFLPENLVEVHLEEVTPGTRLLKAFRK